MTTTVEQGVIDAARLLLRAREEGTPSLVDAFLGVQAAVEAYEAECASTRELLRTNDRGAVRRDAALTSEVAADRIPNRGSLRHRIWKLFIVNDRGADVVEYPYRGFTDFELEVAVQRAHTTVSSARRDLVLFGLIEASGEVRFKGDDPEEKYPSQVWVLTAKGRSLWKGDE